MKRTKPNFETVAKGIRTRVLSIASPSFYRAPLSICIKIAECLNKRNSLYTHPVQGRILFNCSSNKFHFATVVVRYVLAMWMQKLKRW